MPRRSILSAAERESLLVLPDSKDDLIRHYTLSDTDLSIIRQRRGPANRLGFAVQLCYLRFPGVILGVDEPPFPPLLKLVADQLKVGVERWGEYGQREQTRREHLVERGHDEAPRRRMIEVPHRRAHRARGCRSTLLDQRCRRRRQQESHHAQPFARDENHGGRSHLRRTRAHDAGRRVRIRRHQTPDEQLDAGGDQLAAAPELYGAEARRLAA